MSEIETSGIPRIPSAEPTAGRLLRAAREASGMHIAALAVAMKVPVKKLEALEADRADLLPDAVFVRALASSMCRALRVDSAPVLDLLPKIGSPQLQPTNNGLNEPFRNAGERSSAGAGGLFSRPAFLIVIALLLAALAVFFVPELHWEDFSRGPDEVTSATLATKEVSSEPLAADKQEDRPAPAPVEVVPAPARTEAASAPVVVVPSAPAPVVAAPPSPAAPKSTDMVSIRAKEDTWVEVVDATGTVLLRRIVPAQGVASATGSAPLAVVIGRADAAAVEVRGKPFSISAFSKENVARFEVK
ncbi:helix-turn-helix domain-containing protein [Rhodoferax sp. OV413]|uniref:helix-turn-helix domain-containing protein n=1 Tax=Rhodoferax sp. OV413 TaxID=1855285 RepID=UPI0025FCBEFD|nr:helix-turn-helix domain-containing protein [Rhodoferax sp. OV413]